MSTATNKATTIARRVWQFEPAWQALVAAIRAHREAESNLAAAQREWDRVRKASPHLFPSEMKEPTP